MNANHDLLVAIRKKTYQYECESWLSKANEVSSYDCYDYCDNS